MTHAFGKTAPAEWVSLSATSLAAVVLGFASTVLIVMQAADAVHATDAQKISWAAILCFATAILTLLLSWRTRMPMIIAWSTPGAALMALGVDGITYTQALGAFAACGLLMVLTGLSKPLERAIEAIPSSIASAMLAGVLLHYVLQLPAAALATPALVVPLVVGFFAVRLWKPMYAVPLVVVLGLLLASFNGQVAFGISDITFSRLTFDLPEFSLAAMIGLAIPLYLVTMASQNLSGFAAMRNNDYQPPIGAALVSTGLTSVLISPFGGPQVNMAAITAAMFTGPEAHPDSTERWKIAFPYFIQYVVVGLAAGMFVKVLGGLPHELIITIAALGLFGPLSSALAAMAKEPRDIEAAVVTFIMTASGITIFGVGSAFWGILAGLILWGIRKVWERR